MKRDPLELILAAAAAIALALLLVFAARTADRLDALEAFTHFDDRPIYYQPLVDLETCVEQDRALREELNAYKAALEQARMDAENQPQGRRRVK